MRALLAGSELSGTIRGVLLADVCADLLQFEPDGRYSLAAGPEMLAGETSLFTGQAGDREGTLPFQKSDHRRHRVLRWNRNAHVNMVWHQVSSMIWHSFCLAKAWKMAPHCRRF
jgi:hypothetical protein